MLLSFLAILAMQPSSVRATSSRLRQLAAWGLSLGLLGFIPFLSPVALTLGVAALGETADGSKAGRGKAEAAVSLGAMGTIIWLLILTAYLVNR